MQPRLQSKLDFVDEAVSFCGDALTRAGGYLYDRVGVRLGSKQTSSVDCIEAFSERRIGSAPLSCVQDLVELGRVLEQCLRPTVSTAIGTVFVVWA
jgi:hypothetical protein